MKYKAKPYEELDGTGYVVDDEGRQLTGVMPWDEAEALVVQYNKEHEDPELALMNVDQLVKDVGALLDATEIKVVNRYQTYQDELYTVELSKADGLIARLTMSKASKQLLLEGYNDYIVNLIMRDPRFKVLIVKVWDGPDYYISYADGDKNETEDEQKS